MAAWGSRASGRHSGSSGRGPLGRSMPVVAMAVVKVAQHCATRANSLSNIRGWGAAAGGGRRGGRRGSRGPLGRDERVIAMATVKVAQHCANRAGSLSNNRGWVAAAGGGRSGGRGGLRGWVCEGIRMALVLANWLGVAWWESGSLIARASSLPVCQFVGKWGQAGIRH